MIVVIKFYICIDGVKNNIISKTLLSIIIDKSLNNNFN